MNAGKTTMNSGENVVGESSTTSSDQPLMSNKHNDTTIDGLGSFPSLSEVFGSPSPTSLAAKICSLES